MKNNLYFILIFFPLIVFSNDWVFSLKDSLYYESDMYSFYGINEWKRSSPEKKKIMVKDYIIRESAYHQGLEDGLNLSPSFLKNLLIGSVSCWLTMFIKWRLQGLRQTLPGLF